MIPILLTIIALWLIVMTFLLTPEGFYRRTFDRITQAKWRDDRVGLQIMLDHLRSFPEEWSISREGASFPLQGAKQIYLTHDNKRGWEYTLNNFGGAARPLDGHFGKQFADQIAHENNTREKQALLKTFYPDLNGPLMLGSK